MEVLSHKVGKVENCQLELSNFTFTHEQTSEQNGAGVYKSMSFVT